MVAVALGAGVGAMILIPLLCCIIGFTCCGVRDGSCAACWQSRIGDVEAGSCFSCLQSCGATLCCSPLFWVFVIAAAAGGGVTHGVLEKDYMTSAASGIGLRIRIRFYIHFIPFCYVYVFLRSLRIILWHLRIGDHVKFLLNYS